MKYFKMFFCMLALIFSMIACERENKSSSNKITNIDMSQEVDCVTLDPYKAEDPNSQRVISNVYSRLYTRTMEKNKDLGVKAKAMLSEMSILDDSSIKFVIKENMKFHNGIEVTSEDVKFSLEQCKKSPVFGQLLKGIISINIINKYEFIIKVGSVKKDLSTLIDNLSSTPTSIVNKEFYLQNKDKMDSAECGSGPFYLDNWDKNTSMTLRRYKHYYNYSNNNKIESIRIFIIPKEEDRILALETGEHHISFDVGIVGALAIEENKKIDLYTDNYLNVCYLGFNIKSKNLKNLMIRKAVAVGIDRDKIVNKLLNNTGKKANSVLTPRVFGYSYTTRAYDYYLNGGIELLKDVNKKKMGLTLAVDKNNALHGLVAKEIKEDLSKMDIYVKIVELEKGDLDKDTNNGKYDFFIMNIENYCDDPDRTMRQLFYSKINKKPGNKSFYNNEELDDLIDEAEAETNDEKIRQDLYERMQDIVNDEIPVLPIFYRYYRIGVRKDIKDLKIYNDNSIDLSQLSY